MVAISGLKYKKETDNRKKKRKEKVDASNHTIGKNQSQNNFPFFGCFSLFHVAFELPLSLSTVCRNICDCSVRR